MSEVENWDKELTKIVMETKNGYMEDAPEEIYAYCNVLMDASLGLEV